MTTQAIAQANPQIANINKIHPGQVINIPDATARVATAKKTTTAKPVAKKVVVVKQAAAPVAVAAAPVAVAAATNHCAACDNVINNNPLYRPAAGHFYSVTDLVTNTSFKPWGLNEQFGYGISDLWSVTLNTAASTSDSFKKDTMGWDNLGLGTSVRYLNGTNWKGDVYGNLTVNRGMKETFLNQDDNMYLWTVGTKLGYATCTWTLNGLFEYGYANTGAFNWNDVGVKAYTVGLQGQYVFNENWNVTADVKYIMPDFQDANYWYGDLGVNYNFTANTFLGLYVFQTMDKGGNFADDTGLGLRLGVDF
ncbi:MAG: hypothetical protein FWC51_03665 [Proteobacteria bacterium]|nr:hypothetical protein [Pseudomonadota bacterium]